MNEPISIRPAEAADVALILEFIRGLARYERLEHEVLADEAGLHRSLFGARPYAEVVIASLAHEPAGFALFFHNYSTFLARPGLYLEDLYVLPHARGRGVGRRLLEWLACTAVARECGRLEWAVLRWNEPAIGFYRSLGALPMDEWGIFRLMGTALHELAGRLQRLP